MEADDLRIALVGPRAVVGAKCRCDSVEGGVLVRPRNLAIVAMKMTPGLAHQPLQIRQKGRDRCVIRSYTIEETDRETTPSQQERFTRLELHVILRRVFRALPILSVCFLVLPIIFQHVVVGLGPHPLQPPPSNGKERSNHSFLVRAEVEDTEKRCADLLAEQDDHVGNNADGPYRKLCDVRWIGRVHRGVESADNSRVSGWQRRRGLGFAGITLRCMARRRFERIELGLVGWRVGECSGWRLGLLQLAGRGSSSRRRKLSRRQTRYPGGGGGGEGGLDKVGCVTDMRSLTFGNQASIQGAIARLRLRAVVGVLRGRAPSFSSPCMPRWAGLLGEGPCRKQLTHSSRLWPCGIALPAPCIKHVISGGCGFRTSSGRLKIHRVRCVPPSAASLVPEKDSINLQEIEVGTMVEVKRACGHVNPLRHIPWDHHGKSLPSTASTGGGHGGKSSASWVRGSRFAVPKGLRLLGLLYAKLSFISDELYPFRMQGGYQAHPTAAAKTTLDTINQFILDLTALLKPRLQEFCSIYDPVPLIPLQSDGDEQSHPQGSESH
ncbi:hypothetical protein DFP72DRAFT_856885 [Ephemerocybe angulata]|uniref:Uncharacterized protein n=1 Tax=Ephemerocybe angulata TaxID=980116 RepID=A0A8H6HEZ4_9AGAR|nr:hypothetical protein DFP72DRAFT_856885 [Tulosesus angulatus]